MFSSNARYVMEGHLVHYNAKYNNVSDAVASGDPHGLTVLGVIFHVRFSLALDSHEFDMR